MLFAKDARKGCKMEIEVLADVFFPYLEQLTRIMKAIYLPTPPQGKPIDITLKCLHYHTYMDNKNILNAIDLFHGFNALFHALLVLIVECPQKKKGLLIENLQFFYIEEGSYAWFE